MLRASCSEFLTVFLVLFLYPFLAYGFADNEAVPTEVILLVREREVLVFDGLRGVWVSESIQSGERVIEKKADGHVAIVVTNNRVLGYSSLTNFWSTKNLMSGENFVSLSVKDNVGAVITDLRGLGFSARRGQWVETKLHLK